MLFSLTAEYTPQAVSRGINRIAFLDLTHLALSSLTRWTYQPRRFKARGANDTHHPHPFGMRHSDIRCRRIHAHLGCPRHR
jgi:hypothetical protein